MDANRGCVPGKYTLNPDGLMNELCLSSPWVQARVAKCKELAICMRDAMTLERVTSND